MVKSIEDFLNVANEEEIISREKIFKKATRGVNLEILEIPEWTKTIFSKYLNLELNLNKMLKEIQKASAEEGNLYPKLFYVGVICGRIEEIISEQCMIDNFTENKLLKIKNVPLTAKETDFTLAFCAFLDDFNRAYDKYSLIEEEPLKTDYITLQDYCALAAAAHKLAEDNDITVPMWVFKAQYISDKPYYAFNTKDKKYQQFLEQTSPREYAKRNIFLGENVLSRI